MAKINNHKAWRKLRICKITPVGLSLSIYYSQMTPAAKLLAPLLVSAFAISVSACSSSSSSETKIQGDTIANTRQLAPKMPFNADSAYSFIKDQLAFGPRVPGSAANRKCADYIVNKLHRYGADDILIQDFTATEYTGKKLNLRNIMGRFGNPDLASPRILLIAHYDTRPWANRDDNADNHTRPLPGANDGGSGVAVLLELARSFSQQRPDVGIDLLFVDGEDSGDGSNWDDNDETWCLGSQYWATDMPEDYTNNPPRFGILLDMVGAKGARFCREAFSNRDASNVVDKVWSVAKASGYGSIFLNRPTQAVIDDHCPVNGAGIPTIDIVDVDNRSTGTFPESWHTMDDNIDIIDPSILQAVGTTVSNVIYYEKQ